MKITSDQTPPPPPPDSNPDLPRRKNGHRKPDRRRATGGKKKTPRLQIRKDGSVKRASPNTPLLRWKFDDGGGDRPAENVAGEGMEEFGGRRGRIGGKGGGEIVSVRRIGAALWRLQAPEGGGGGAGDDRLGFKRGSSHVGEQEQVSSHHGSRGFVFEAKGQPRSPCSVNGPMDGYACEPQASFKFSNYAMEGATKWDPVRPEKNEESGSFQFNKKQDALPMVSALQADLEQAQRRIEELESERRSSKKKLKHFLLKLSEERAAWRSREHEKVRAIISDVKADLTRERKNYQRLEVVNSKLVNELAEAKMVMKRYMQDFEKERKNRELVEEVCDELAKEIGEDKAEVEELKAECMKIRDEVDDERKMLQMAEVWREERVQMKLIDARVTLENKYNQMNKLIVDLQQFLRSKSGALDPREIKEAELLQQASASVKIHDLKEFTYEPPKSDDIFSIFEEMGMGETSEREIEPCDAYSPASQASKMHHGSSELNAHRGDKNYRHSNAYGSQNDDLDDDRSGWETVSQADDQDSSFSPEGSIASLNKAAQRDSNVSGSGTEWGGNGGDETPMSETSEVCSVRSKHLKKVSSISRLWRSLPKSGDNYKIISVDGVNGRLSNGRISNGGGGYALSDLPGQWSSPDTGNPHMGRGTKGCIEWPRGQKHSLKAKLLEARVESQKIQLRQVLKQKI